MTPLSRNIGNKIMIIIGICLISSVIQSCDKINFQNKAYNSIREKYYNVSYNKMWESMLKILQIYNAQIIVNDKNTGIIQSEINVSNQQLFDYSDYTPKNENKIEKSLCVLYIVLTKQNNGTNIKILATFTGTEIDFKPTMKGYDVNQETKNFKTNGIFEKNILDSLY
jgi:hypothetical protein